MDELELTELECDAVLLDDDAWNAKYAPSEPAPEPEAPEEPADPNEWMHSYLARLLPESMQSKEKIWNGTISALKAADVRSKEQLDAMSSDDLKTANVPMTARHYIVKDRKGQVLDLHRLPAFSQSSAEGPEDPSSGRSPQSGLNTPASNDGRYHGATDMHSQNPSETSSSTSRSVASTTSTASDSTSHLVNVLSSSSTSRSVPSTTSTASDSAAPLLHDASVRAGGGGGVGGGE
jgi:hypothetical protein